jgi:hypothetical protein
VSTGDLLGIRMFAPGLGASSVKFVSVRGVGVVCIIRASL